VIASIESNFIMDDVRYDINVSSYIFPSLLVIFSYSPYAPERAEASLGARGYPIPLCPVFCKTFPEQRILADFASSNSHGGEV
jgi:hypothetical protein